MDRATFVTFTALFVLWLWLNGSLDPDVVWAGLGVALILTLLFRRQAAIFADFRLTPGALWATFGYLFFFVKELVKSNLNLAAIVLSPALPLKPGIVKVRTRLQSPMGRLMLANSITLTPGTLSVELRDEWLYVHWVSMTADDIETATREIVAGFESYLEVMYG
ncbi:MAG: Na+/H+ antiporter subunit E [Pseudomonadota bacterium]